MTYKLWTAIAICCKLLELTNYMKLGPLYQEYHQSMKCRKNVDGNNKIAKFWSLKMRISVDPLHDRSFQSVKLENKLNDKTLKKI